MSTNASITVKHTDGKYYGIYVHFDGYPKGVLATLRKHYNSQELAEKLVSSGDAVSIKETLETCEFYERNHLIQSLGPKEGSTWKEVLDDIGQVYDYIYANNKWDVLED